MPESNRALKLYISLFKLMTENSRKFTGGLDGLGFSEFVILYTLMNNADKRLRRIDLAECMGLTASGVTRLLGPMEKIGLVEREASAGDARVSYVKITASGERNFKESCERAERLAVKIFSTEKADLIEKLIGTIDE
jgi:DNA-binding MarR family transcriptional regulator